MTTAQFSAELFTVQGGLGQQAVAGEKLGAADHHQHQAEGEDAAAEQSGDADADESGGVLRYNRRQLRAKGDIEAGQQAQHDGAGQGLRGDPFAACDEGMDRFGGGEKAFFHKVGQPAKG
jgi:hypothetical protein